MANLSSSMSTGDFNIGSIISEGFDILNKALPRFLALAVIPILPLVLMVILSVGAAQALAPQASGTASTYGIIVGGLSLLSVVLTLAIQGAMVYGAFNEIRGRQFSVGEALSKGLARFLPLLGVAILTGLAVMIGIVLLVVPGLIFACMLYAAIPACVVEQAGVFASLSRSSELTKGYRWKILGLLVLVTIGGAIVGAILGFLVGLVSGALFGPVINLVVIGIVKLIVQTYSIALGSVLAALAYYRLRSIKEGIDIDRIAEVFD